MSLHHMFYFGVILPTALVIIFFIIFLVCWFKCNLRHRFQHKNGQKSTSHNSTQSSLVTASSGLPYPHGPPSKDYWEIDVDHHQDSSVDTRKEPKYIPGDFSVRSGDWIYMLHDEAQTLTTKVRSKHENADVQVHAWNTTTPKSCSGSETSSVSSQGSRNCMDGRASPEDIFINSNRSSPDSMSKLRVVDHTLPLRVMDNNNSANLHWKMIPNPENLPHNYPATKPGFEFAAGQSPYICSPYAITNLIHAPTPAIRV